MYTKCICVYIYLYIDRYSSFTLYSLPPPGALTHAHTDAQLNITRRQKSLYSPDRQNAPRPAHHAPRGGPSGGRG